MGFFNKDWRDPYRRLSDPERLARIRNGDSRAEEFLFETYYSMVVAHMEVKMREYGKPDELSATADDYAQDAILLLITQARSLGADVLKHDYTTIGGWLKQTAFNFRRNQLRADDRLERDTQLDEDGSKESVFAKLEDKGADSFTDMSKKDRDQIVQERLATLPEELRTLIQLKYMDGYTWPETAEIMCRLFPDHKPPFERAYLQQTYWDRVHKKPFIKRLGDDLDDL